MDKTFYNQVKEAYEDYMIQEEILYKHRLEDDIDQLIEAMWYGFDAELDYIMSDIKNRQGD